MKEPRGRGSRGGRGLGEDMTGSGRNKLTPQGSVELINDPTPGEVGASGEESSVKPHPRGGSGAEGVARRDWERLLRTALRVRHYALRTEQTYFQWARQFLEFHAQVALTDLAVEHVQVFLEHLAVGRNVAASTQNQALSALLSFSIRCWSGSWERWTRHCGRSGGGSCRWS
jgi:hypothetical protein